MTTILNVLGALAFWIVAGMGTWWILKAVGIRFVIRR